MAGVVAALGAEARTLGSPTRRSDGLYSVGDGALLAVSGMGCAAAAAAEARLIEAGATALVSGGMAGGLDPALAAGTLCLPTMVISRAGARCATDLHWRELLGAAIGGRLPLVGGTLLTSAVAIDDVATKAALFDETGAVAVDMESMAVAEVAVAHDLPFVAVRVIVDTAADSLPESVVAAGRDGQVRIASLLLGIIRAPSELRAVLRLAQRYRVAIRALVAVAATGALAQLAEGASQRARIS